MNLFEFFYFTFYLGFLTGVIIIVQLMEATRLEQEKQRKKIESLQEEEDVVSEEEEIPTKPFDPENEPYTMTENPMFRHRTSCVEQTS